MTTILYNKFKNTQFKDVNSLGYAIKTLSGDIICIDGIIKTDNLESAASNSNITIKNKLKINIGSSGCAIDLGAGDTTRTNNFYGTIRYREFGGLVLTGDEASKRIDMFADNVYIHANLNVDSVFYLNSIFYCNSLSSQPGNSVLLNSNDTYHVLINYFKPSSGNVIFNRSCPYSNVNIEMGNLNVQSGNLVVSGNTTLTNNLVVSNGTTILRNTTISGNLIVTGTLIYSSLGSSSLLNSLYVTGYSTFNNTITCNYGIINYNSPLYNYSYLNQLFPSFFSNLITCSGIINNSYLNQVGNSSFTNLMITNGITNSSSPIINYNNLTQIGSSFFSNLISCSGIINNSYLSQVGNSSFTNLMITNGITNSTRSITNNSTLSQVGTTSFIGKITCQGGITNNNIEILNNSTLNQVGSASFTNLMTTKGITNSTAPIINYNNLTQISASTFMNLITSSGIINYYYPFYNYNSYNQIGSSFFSNLISCSGILNNSYLSQVGNSSFTNLMITNGITNSTRSITNNSTLSQVGTTTFIGKISCNGGIINNNIEILNNSTLKQVGSSLFQGLINSNGITNSTAPIINYNNLTQISASTFMNLITCSGSINYNYPFYNYSSLNQIGGSIFTSLITSNAGITNSNAAITNNSTLSQIGSASFNSASFTSITNNGLLTTNNLELGPNGSTFTYLDLKTTGGNSDYDIRIGCTNGSSTTSGNGVLSFNCLSCTINSPLTANSGTFSGITNNTNAITNNSTLSQVGSATFTTTSTFNDNINILVGKSLYVGTTNYIRIHQSGGGSFIDFTDGLNIRNAGSTTVLALNSSNNQGTFNYNLNTTGITNNTNAIVNNGILTQNSTANINSDLNVTGGTFLSSTGSFPIGSTGGTQGIGFFWNKNTGLGDSCFLNYSQNGGGGFSFHCTGNGTAPLTGPTQLMKLDSAKNLSLLNNISCVSLTATGNITCASLNDTGSIYMNNASPIYLKSSSDTNHYIKYDSVYDGPQLGFFTGVSIKCTDNNAIIFNASKTLANININTKITGTLVTTGAITVNGFNNSYYYSIKGKTYNNASLNTYTNESTLYDGTTSTSSLQDIQVPSTCWNVKISYFFDSSITNYQVQAAVEYVFYKNITNSTWTFGTSYNFGTNTFPPTITINSSNVLRIIYPANSTLTGYINYSFGIWLI